MATWDPDDFAGGAPQAGERDPQDAGHDLGQDGGDGGVVPPYVIEEITRAVELALARRGVPGTVTLRGESLYLSTAPSGPGLPISPWAGRWPVAGEDERLRRASEAARFLAEARGNSLRPGPSGRPSWAPASRGPNSLSPGPVGGSAPPTRRVVVDPALVLLGLVVVIGAYLAWPKADAAEDSVLVDRTRQSRDAAPNSDTITEIQPPPRAQAANHGGIERERATTGRSTRDARSARVCAATRARVQQGGTVSVADVDGWVVEIAIFKAGGTEPLHTQPSLARYVEAPHDPGGSKFIWDKERTLAPIDTSDTRVRLMDATVRSDAAVRNGPAVASGHERIPGVILQFGGTLVDAYFKEDERARYYHIAHSLADDLGGTHAALYARCFDEEIHALGSWFRGTSAASASAALIYFMGTYASPLHIAKPYYATVEDEGVNRFHAFTTIVDKTRFVDREALATVVGSEGGMATGKRDEPVTITLPFGDGNRAARASHALARVTSLR